MTGIAFDRRAEGGNAVLYVTHSDPEIFEDEQPGDSTVDPSLGHAHQAGRQRAGRGRVSAPTW